MLEQLQSLLAFGAMAMTAFGLGRPLVRGLGVGQEDGLSVAVWSVALGLIAAGAAISGLGLLGGLYVPVLGMMTMIGCFWGLGEILRVYLRRAEQQAFPTERVLPPPLDEPEEPPFAPPSPWLLRGVLAAAGLACLGSLVGALAPPTAGDAMCYHLELPKTFLAAHRIEYLPHHDNATFPLLTEMWYLWGLALEGGVCAQLVHWGLGVLLALAAVVLVTPILGRSWAWVVGALVVLTPGVNNQMTAPLCDVALAAMTTLAMAAWWRAVVNDEDRRWFVVAGLAAGAALGTKYLALVFAGAVAATWLWAVVRQPGRRRFLLEGAAVVAVIAVSVGGIWYARAAWYRGNPVFPFLSEVFPGHLQAIAGRPETLPEAKSPLGRGPLGLATAPWLVTMQPERFGGRGHQLGVLPLAALPGLLLGRRLRGLGTLLAVALMYCALWYLLRQNVRFLFPAMPLLAVGVAWVWIEMRRFPARARWVAAGAFAVAVAAMAVAPVLRAREHLAVALGRQEREDYLMQHEPTYPAAAVANLMLPPEAHLLSQDYRAFYFRCRVTRENVFRRHTRYDDRVTHPADLGRELRAAGFTHLLLAETLSGNGIQYDPTLSRLADAELSSPLGGSLRMLTAYKHHDADGTVRRYRLIALCGD